ICARGEKERGRGFRELAELDDALALKAVGGVAGDEYQKRRGEELHQPDHAQCKGRTREIVDLPADRDRRDLAGKTGQAAREQEGQERRMLEEFAGADRRVHGHWLLLKLLFLGEARGAPRGLVLTPRRD